LRLPPDEKLIVQELFRGCDWYFATDLAGSSIAEEKQERVHKIGARVCFAKIQRKEFTRSSRVFEEFLLEVPHGGRIITDRHAMTC
jgi:hypothetical protein